MKEGCLGCKPGLTKCTILSENLCETRGKCSFYITREDARKGREAAERSLKERGLRPVVKMRRERDGTIHPIQSVTFL